MKSVSIVGSAPSSQHLAPYGDGEVWVTGPQSIIHIECGQKFTRIFEIHSTPTVITPEYVRQLVSFGKPVVVNRDFIDRESNVVELFDHERAMQFLESNGKAYLTSSVAYMIAYAVMHSYEKISIYGVDLCVDDNEYFYQRACVEAWIGLAKGRGIDVFIPSQSSILKSTYVYGIDNHQASGPFTESSFLEMAKKHQSAIAGIDEQVELLSAKRRVHEGCYQTLVKLSNVARGVDAGADIEDLSKVLLVKQ